MQGQALDLTWLVQPGTVSGSLLTGMLGLQPQPTVVEVGRLSAFAVPMGLYVIWPDRWRRSTALLPCAASPQLPRLRRRFDDRPKGPTPTHLPGRIHRARLPAVRRMRELGRPARRSDEALLQAHRRGCDPAQASAPAGPVTFDVTNDGAAGVTELEILDGEASSASARTSALGLSGNFTVTLDAGHLHAQLPGRRLRRARHPDRHGDSRRPARATKARPGGRRTTAATSSGQTSCRRPHHAPFVAALKAGDDAEGQGPVRHHRCHYERIEPIAESFGDLDPEIDARANDVADGRSGRASTASSRSSGWTNTTQGNGTGTPTSCWPTSSTCSDRSRRSSSSRRRSPTAPSGCSTRSRPRRSPARRTATRTPTCRTSRPTSTAPRQAFDAVEPVLRGQRDQRARRRRSSSASTAVEQGLDAVQARRRPSASRSTSELTEQDTPQLAQQVDALAEPLSLVAGEARCPLRADAPSRVRSILLGGGGAALRRWARPRPAGYGRRATAGARADGGRPPPTRSPSTAPARPASPRPPRRGCISPPSTSSTTTAPRPARAAARVDRRRGRS